MYKSIWEIFVDSKRADLVAATKDLLWDVGYGAMSPRKILDASGAGQGSLYHHFSGKRAIAAAALTEIDAEMRGAFGCIVQVDLPPLERVRRFLSEKREGMKGCRLGRLANETAIADDVLRRPIADFFAHVETALAAALAEARGRGDIVEKIDTDALAVALVAIVQGGYVLSRIHRDGTRMRDACAGALAMLDAVTVGGKRRKRT